MVGYCSKTTFWLYDVHEFGVGIDGLRCAWRAGGGVGFYHFAGVRVECGDFECDKSKFIINLLLLMQGFFTLLIIDLQNDNKYVSL
jgi:hypothetical protein